MPRIFSSNFLARGPWHFYAFYKHKKKGLVIGSDQIAVVLLYRIQGTHGIPGTKYLNEAVGKLNWSRFKPAVLISDTMVGTKGRQRIIK